MPVFPYKKTCHLRYSTNFQLTTNVGVVASYVFASNGLFDPDVTGTGHQPMGFDQMMLSYNHYCVLSSRIIVTAVNTTSGPVPTFVVSARSAATPVTVIDQILEFGILNKTDLESKSVSGDVKTLECRSVIRRMTGKPLPINDPNLCGDINTNPTEVEYYHIQLFDQAGNTSTVNFKVIIEFVATFFEPRVLVESLRKQLHLLVANAETKIDPSPTSRSK